MCNPNLGGAFLSRYLCPLLAQRCSRGFGKMSDSPFAFRCRRSFLDVAASRRFLLCACHILLLSAV